MANYGLLAFGSSGDWELAVDELRGERPGWCLQIDSSVVSLRCRITTLTAFAALKRLLDSPRSHKENQNTAVQVGVYNDQPVVVQLDDEFADRCFIVAGDSADARLEVTLAGANYVALREACSQVVEDLELDQ